jgi:hypothetical protein
MNSCVSLDSRDQFDRLKQAALSLTVLLSQPGMRSSNERPPSTARLHGGRRGASRTRIRHSCPTASWPAGFHLHGEGVISLVDVEVEVEAPPLISATHIHRTELPPTLATSLGR